MRTIAFCSSLLLLVFSGCATAPVPNLSPPPAQHQGFVIAGSGTNLPHIKALAEQFDVDKKLDIRIPNSVGSIGAIKGIREGAIDLGFTSRSLTKEEKSDGLKELAYAKIGLMVACHEDVPIDDISYAELIQIYRGEKTKWSNGKRIVSLAMYLEDSTNEVLFAEMPNLKDALIDAIRTKRVHEFYNNQSLDLAIRKTPSSIGFSNAVFRQGSGVKLLQVNGTAPTRDNILNGSYRLHKVLYFVYKEPLHPEAKRFIDFAFSSKGRQILDQYECISLGR